LEVPVLLFGNALQYLDDKASRLSVFVLKNKGTAIESPDANRFGCEGY